MLSEPPEYSFEPSQSPFSSLNPATNHEQKYAPRLKFFGERAQRVSRAELHQVIDTILAPVRDYFTLVSPAEEMADKDSFGDIDIICLPTQKLDPEFFQTVYGDKVEGYHRNDAVHSVLLRVSPDKAVQVDFIRADDETAYYRKLIYYSKGHLSAIIGVLSKQLNYKYGTDGFFKRFRDAKGQWHDVLVSENLLDGMRILGLNPHRYHSLTTAPDIVEFVSASPYFDSNDYDVGNLLRRDRLQQNRNAQQQYLMSQLAATNKTRQTENTDEILQTEFPAAFQAFQDKIAQINAEISLRKAIDGRLIMTTFGLSPGPEVGQVTRFLHQNYPEATELSQDLIEEIKAKVLR